MFKVLNTVKKNKAGQEAQSAGAQGELWYEIGFAMLSKQELVKSWTRALVTEMVKTGQNLCMFQRGLQKVRDCTRQIS